MKNIIILSILFNTYCVSAQTSVYHPFPDSNSVWNFNLKANCFANGSANENYSIAISGDTTINSQIYNKLYTPFVVSFSTGTCGGILNGYKGAIRQDLTSQKVYFIPPQDTSELILYDFTLQVGDTVRGQTHNLNFQKDTIISIDSVLIGNSFRKRWNINTCYNISFIEGIGSTYGLLEKSPGCLTDFPDYSLTCFQQNSQTVYPDTNNNCQIITTLKNIPKIKEQISIYPNPSNGSLTIDFSPNQIKEITVINLLGDIILNQLVNEINTFKIKHLPKGYFFLIMIDRNNNTITKRIISTY